MVAQLPWTGNAPQGSFDSSSSVEPSFFDPAQVSACKQSIQDNMSFLFNILVASMELSTLPVGESDSTDFIQYQDKVGILQPDDQIYKPVSVLPTVAKSKVSVSDEFILFLVKCSHQ
jgi:hypothetical protein